MAEVEKSWWENYSPIPLEKIPATVRSTLSPKEVVIAKSETSFLLIVWLIFSPINIIKTIFTLGIFLLIQLFGIHRRVIVVTNQRIIGVFNVKVFSSDKVDLPLRSIDSFGVDDTTFGNLFGYTKIKLMSRSSTYFFPFITKNSCQELKNAYYAWDEKQSR
jgi:hypothetical protein